MPEPLQESEDRRHPKWHAMAFFVLAGVLMGLIVIASWAADSRMTALRWVPGWMADWADSDPNIRTVIPFIPLAFSLVLGFSWRRFKWPVLWAVMVSGACLSLSEFGQMFLPQRTADLRDLMWGGIGIAVGAVAAQVALHRRGSVRMKSES